MVEKIKKLAEKVQKLKEKDINEAATKDYLIRPFFDDIKMINEKMNYCLNAQVPFLIITNGMLYNIYYSELKGSSHERLLFDLRLDEKIDEEILNKLKKESFEKDDLLKYAQDTFILSNIKKSFESLLQEPSKKFLTLINEKMKEIIGYTFGDSDIKNALQNIYIQINQDNNYYQTNTVQPAIAGSEQKQWTINDQFNEGKWENTFNLYKELIIHLQSEGLKFEENPTKLYIGFLTKSNKKSFCQIHGQQKVLKILVNINIKELTEQEKLNVRDVSKIGRWGTGETEVIISTAGDLNWAVNIIKKAYNLK